MLTPNHPRTSMKSIQKLNQLSSALDTILFRNMEEDEDKKRRGLPVGTIAATGAALYGADRLRKRYGADQYEGIGNQAKATVSGVRREAGDIASRYYDSASDMVKKKAKAASTAATKAWTRGGSVTSAAGPVKPMPFIKRVGRSAMAGFKGMVHAEANIAQRIVALDAMLDQVNELRAKRVEFRDMAEDMARAKGQTEKGNYWRGGLIGGVGGVLPAHSYTKAGKVYRKRDALRDGLVGGAVSGVGGLALAKQSLKAISEGKMGKYAAIQAGLLGAGIGASNISAKRALKKRQQASE